MPGRYRLMANGRIRIFFVAAVTLVLLPSVLAYTVGDAAGVGPLLVSGFGLAIVAVAVTCSVVARRRRLHALLHGSPEPDRQLVG